MTWNKATGTPAVEASSMSVTYPTQFTYVVFGFKVNESYDTLRLYGSFGVEADAEECLAKVKARYDKDAKPGSFCGMSRCSVNQYLDDDYWDDLQVRTVQ